MGPFCAENILFNMADTVVVMADETKFVKFINRSIPVEVHPTARSLVKKRISMLGGTPGTAAAKIRIPGVYRKWKI